MSTKTIPAEQAERHGHGMCVAVIERNGYHDSDFTAIFAKPDGFGGYDFVNETTGSTAYAGGYIAHEDATDEVLVAYRDKRASVMANLSAARAEREAKMVDKGKAVTVVKAVTRGKNKVDAGATGTVLAREVNAFDSRWAIATDNRSYRVRVALDHEDRVVWMDEDRVRVTGFEAEDAPVRDLQVDYIVAGAWPNR